MENQKEIFKNLNSDCTLTDIQVYIKKISDLRGLSNQTIKDKFLLLTE